MLTADKKNTRAFKVRQSLLVTRPSLNSHVVPLIKVASDSESFSLVFNVQSCFSLPFNK